QADLLGVPVIAPTHLETTGVGAAALAAVGAGLDTPAELAGRWQASRTWEPIMSRDEAETLLEGWNRALEACRAVSGGA
ncbi:MAG: glycerol kinase, partial [Solirubrobacterales bacterium]